MEYFFSIDGANQKGPVAREQLVASGVRPGTMIWREGWANWMPAGEAAELTDLFTAAPPAPAASVTPAYAPVQASSMPASYAQPAYATPGPLATSGMAIASMVLGIIGLIPCCTFLIPSLLAVIFGHIAKADTRRTGRPGSGMATAGMVMGYIGLILGVGFFAISMVGNLHTTRSWPGSGPPISTPVIPVPKMPALPNPNSR